MSTRSPSKRLQHLGLRSAECRLVQVTARMQTGVVAPPVFPLPLDGILAGAARRRRLGRSYGALVDHHVEDLPLLPSWRLHPKEVNPRLERRVNLRAQWWWCASCALLPDDAEEDVRWFHKRSFDTFNAERVVGVENLPQDVWNGRFKAWRLPAVATVVPKLRWFAVGDPQRISDLLDDVAQIGKKTGMGEGLVLEWRVEDLGDPDPSRCVIRDDGRPARPLPARHAPLLGHNPDTVETIPATIRPPYWRPPMNNADGGRHRAWKEVIAPWVTST